MLSYFLACFEVVWCSDVVARETFSPSTQNVFGGHFALQSLCLLWHFAFPQRSVNVWFHTLLAIRSGQGLSWLLCDTIDIEVSQTSSASLPRGLQFMADLWLAQFRQKLHLQTTFPLNLCSRGAMFCHLHPALELESRLRRLPQPRQTLEERWNRHIGGPAREQSLYKTYDITFTWFKSYKDVRHKGHKPRWADLPNAWMRV